MRSHFSESNAIDQQDKASIGFAKSRAIPPSFLRLRLSVFNDVAALGVIEAIQLAGLKAGAGFGIIGFDDVPADTEPALTTKKKSLAKE